MRDARRKCLFDWPVAFTKVILIVVKLYFSKDERKRGGREGGERGKVGERETERDRQRNRQTDTEPETDRDRETETKIQR